MDHYSPQDLECCYKSFNCIIRQRNSCDDLQSTDGSQDKAKEAIIQQTTAVITDEVVYDALLRTPPRMGPNLADRM